MSFFLAPREPSFSLAKSSVPCENFFPQRYLIHFIPFINCFLATTLLCRKLNICSLNKLNYRDAQAQSASYTFNLIKTIQSSSKNLFVTEFTSMYINTLQTVAYKSRLQQIIHLPTNYLCMNIGKHQVQLRIQAPSGSAGDGLQKSNNFLWLEAMNENPLFLILRCVTLRSFLVKGNIDSANIIYQHIDDRI